MAEEAPRGGHPQSVRQTHIESPQQHSCRHCSQARHGRGAKEQLQSDNSNQVFPTPGGRCSTHILCSRACRLCEWVLASWMRTRQPLAVRSRKQKHLKVLLHLFILLHLPSSVSVLTLSILEWQRGDRERQEEVGGRQGMQLWGGLSWSRILALPFTG
jgi:hypothetical protein